MTRSMKMHTKIREVQDRQISLSAPLVTHALNEVPSVLLYQVLSRLSIENDRSMCFVSLRSENAISLHVVTHAALSAENNGKFREHPLGTKFFLRATRDRALNISIKYAVIALTSVRCNKRSVFPTATRRG